MAKWLPHCTQNRVVWMWVNLADIIVLCSLARDLYSHFASPTEVYKCVQGQIQEFLKGVLGDTLTTLNAISLQLLEWLRNPPWRFFPILLSKTPFPAFLTLEKHF